ncbi:MAG: EAL domain-containing protein [Proteobacteria bacterium]|nr:EAL domain-containing protein [Pseudomonadota bacterium]
MIGEGDVLSAGILIVDDSAVNVRLLERMLLTAGYSNVTSTTDSTTVVALYREHRYDLILLDLLMPGTDGFEVMRGLHEIETEGYLPVLVLTAQPAHKLRALQAGAKDFISKPFDQIEVLTRIRNMVEVRLLLREAKRYGKLLEHYDGLTGLPNRAKFRELLATAQHQPDEHRGIVSVVMVSIDRFKNITDAMGRETGDALLRCVGDRLAACIDPLDTAARVDSEQFGLLVATSRAESQGAGMVAKRVRDALRAPLRTEGLVVSVTVSIGIAVSPADSSNPDALMMYAEAALNEARRAGGDTYRFYSDDMNAKALEALALEHALREALEREEFVLHYQPKMRLDTGDWSGVEALLRWDRPGHGLVMPDTFIPMLEETGLIVPVGTWVIQTACRQIGEWARTGMGPMRVAINVSGKQFLRDGFVATVARAIQENDILPEALDIEITESSLMSRTTQTDNVLRELKAFGVWIAVDDFGTGYSSLSYLRRFPIDTLKIDISFVRELGMSPDGESIAIAIINLARSLNLRVVAEGVETVTQLEFLRTHACDEIQGYYCSRPLPAAALAELRLQRRDGARRTALVAIH